MRAAIAAAVLLVAGCGSAPLPPPAGPQPPPVSFHGRTARLDVRARTLTWDGRSVAAGVGPAAIASGSAWLYVADRTLGALLVYDTHPRLELQRRVYLPGGPSALAVDLPRRRLWVALAARDEVVQLTADGAAKVRGRFPTLHAPVALSVDPATGAVTVRGAGGRRQLLARRTA